MELKPRHLRAIELLAATDLRKGQVAAAVGVSRGTIARWLKDKAFRAELALRRQLLPYHLDGLRMEAARRALTDLVERLGRPHHKAPLKELMRVLGQLVGDDFARAYPQLAPAGRAEAQPSAASEGDTNGEKAPNAPSRLGNADSASQGPQSVQH